ncbi:MAG: lamin tail domain-containing protein [Spirochaetia bacterium]|nr:lamin tail domain-containing protein [Spirochaetia bacterium]
MRKHILTPFISVIMRSFIIRPVIMRRIIILLFLLLIIMLPVHAEDRKLQEALPEFIVINEAASQGEYDFIELLNLSSEAAVFSSGWFLDDDKKGYDDGNSSFVIPEGTVIEGNGYLLICPFSPDNAKDVLNNKHIPRTALCDISFSLGSSDEVNLYFREELADSVSWDSDVNSYGRSPDNVQDFSHLLIRTPGKENKKEKLYTSGPEANLTINEICSVDEDYVELYYSGDSVLKMEEGTWFLEDIDKQRDISLPSATVSPGSFILIYTQKGSHDLGLGRKDSVFLRFKDSIVDYCRWNEHVDSYGSYPDGSKDRGPMDKTPGSANSIP